MEINFSYTNRMVLNLLSIERNRSIIDSSRLKDEDSSYLRDRAIVNSAFFGCKLEDEKLQVGDVEEKREIRNYVNLLQGFKNHGRLYANLLIIFNNQLTRGIFREEFTFDTETENMESLVDFILCNREFPDVIIIGIAHYVLNGLAPFRHRCGQTINAIDSFLFYIKGIDSNQYLNLTEELYRNKQLYESLLEGELTTWLEFFTEAVSKAMDQLRKEVISLESDFDLSEKEIMILEYLEENGCIQNRHVQELLDISSKTAHSYLDRLLEKEIIRREGKGRSIHYRLKAQ